MAKVFLLREQPLFKIKIQTDGFILHNQEDKTDNHFYEFNKIDTLRVEKKIILKHCDMVSAERAVQKIKRQIV